MILGTLFKFDGTKKMEKKLITRQHKLKYREERKVIRQLKRTFGVSKSDEWKFYLEAMSQRWVSYPTTNII